MAPKTLGSDLWDLALRSQKLWEELADSLSEQGLDPLEQLGWKKTGTTFLFLKIGLKEMTFCLLVLGMFQVQLSFFIGSLLVGRTPEELEMLKRRVKQQCEAGLRAEYLSATDLRVKEPELMVDKDTGAAFLPDDSQLDARRAVEFLEKVFFFFFS
jgi:glycine/D-amino acid oxidase-like deaminating enzyme